MKGMVATNKQKTEAQKNYEAFRKMNFPPHLNGRYALLRNRKVVLVYHTREDAFRTGLHFFKKVGAFSIQQIGEKPADLGFVGACLASPLDEFRR